MTCIILLLPWLPFKGRNINLWIQNTNISVVRTLVTRGGDRVPTPDTMQHVVMLTATSLPQPRSAAAEESGLYAMIS